MPAEWRVVGFCFSISIADFANSVIAYGENFSRSICRLCEGACPKRLVNIIFAMRKNFVIYLNA